MKNDYLNRFDSLADEKLYEILLSKKGKYKKEAINAVTTILENHGNHINYEELYIEKYKDYYDNDLVKLIMFDKDKLHDIEKIIIIEILKQRGIEFKEPTSQIKVAKKKKRRYRQTKNNDNTPLIIGGLLILFWFFVTINKHRYWNFLHDYGLVLKILTVIISFIFVLTYAKKHNSKYLFAWAAAGLLLSPLSLFIIGIIEVFKDYKND